MVHRSGAARCAGPEPRPARKAEAERAGADRAAGPCGRTRIAIVPKGLRSFDANDSDFFFQLLPGPRDKDGLPESLRFWKHRIEAVDDDASPWA